MKTLILGLGNDFIADDGAGVEAARLLEGELRGLDDVEVMECALSGAALLDILIDYDRVILIDAVKTGQVKPGTISELWLEDLGEVIAPSPHYAGLPELLALARQLELNFPREFVIFAVETEDPYTIGGAMTEPVRAALPEVVSVVLKRLALWRTAQPCAV
ncbi:MAG: hydrogenase maturation protease [bacterium]|nr:hydrogenase maturation protease [bacterium]